VGLIEIDKALEKPLNNWRIAKLFNDSVKWAVFLGRALAK